MPEGSAFAVLSELSRRIPAKTKLVLDVDDLTIRVGKLELKATVKKPKDVDTLVEALKKVPCFKKFNQGKQSEVNVRVRDHEAEEEDAQGKPGDKDKPKQHKMKNEKRRKFSIDITHDCI